MQLDNKFILDACCGGRMFWFNKYHPNTLYIDIEPKPKGICPERPNFSVEPDLVMDFRALELNGKKFKLIVWDPPHMKSLTKTSIMAKKFGCLNADTWRYDLSKGFEELWAHLEEYGVLVFKWNENDILLRKILKLFPVEPLFGHTTGSKSKTHWICFMKIPKKEHK